MKKIYSLLSVLVLSSSMSFAQAPANRTSTTIVADVLAQLPAQQPNKYNSLIKDLLSTGEAGVLELVKMMQDPSKGQNAHLEYALSGITHFVGEDKQEDARKVVEAAYLKSLDVAGDRETKAFVIRQLQLIGRDASVQKLATYLTDKSLVGPAAQALAAIDSPASTLALESALAASTDNDTKSTLINAISNLSTTNIEADLLTYSQDKDQAISKVAMHALSRLGTVASVKTLADAAKLGSYAMDRAGATESYIGLLQKLLKDGEAKLVNKEATNLFKAATKANSLQVKESAIELQMASNGDVSKLLTSALQDPNTEFRNVALTFAAKNADTKAYATALKLLPKAKTEVKVDILNWLTTQSTICDTKRETIGELGRNAFIAELANTNVDVKATAANCLMKVGGHNAIVSLAGLLSNEDAQVVTIAKNALASTKGDVATAVASQMATASDAGKVAALEVIAKRKSVANANTVFGQLTATGDVKAAAYAALQDVVTKNDLNRLYTLLENAEAAEVAPMQKAVISAVRYQSAGDQVKTIFAQMKNAGTSKESLYYPVLAATDSHDALEFIVKAFKSQSGKNKDAAFQSLLDWKGQEAAEELYAISKDPAASVYANQAIDRYIKLASSPQLTGENRRLLLTNAMAVAKTVGQKKAIISELGKTGSYLGMLLAGEYLETEGLKEVSAQAVMRIATNDKTITGKEVEVLLAKVMKTVDNPDAEYQRQALVKHLNEMPKEEGFYSLFNGKDLTGWKGLVENPIARAKMKPAELKKKQAIADEIAKKDWTVQDGLLIFDSEGYDNLCTAKNYGDFEMYLDWCLDPAGKEADAGVYLRGTPQVQIWDISRTNVGAEVGSGGLYNNTVNPSKPSKVADNKMGEWNTFYIKMVGDRVSVSLNGELVVNDVMLENYWDRALPIFVEEQIELQAHGSKVYFRNIYIKELKKAEPFALSAEEKKAGFRTLFDGTNMHQWTGNTVDYSIEEGTISMNPSQAFGGNLYTKEEFSNFVFRFEFQLTPGCNNGLGIRTPLEGDAAYVGMELQILDNDAPIYSNLKKHQYHGSVYGIYAAERGHLKPVGEWNYQEVIADGDNIKVILNGTVITDCNLTEATKNGTADGKVHPGVSNKAGHIAFLGHGSPVKFKNIRIKELK